MTRQSQRPIWGLVSFLFVITLLCPARAQGGDAALNEVRRADRVSRGANGKLAPMSAIEHMRRASVYMLNRVFAGAREHWQALINDYPNDPNVPPALFGIARSYFQERRYQEALQTYERVAREYPQTKEGRDGLNFAG